MTLTKATMNLEAAREALLVAARAAQAALKAADKAINATNDAAGADADWPDLYSLTRAGGELADVVSGILDGGIEGDLIEHG
jgi:hypothetical protein